MPDAFPAHGSRGEAPTAIREGQKASGGPERRGPVHDAVQPYRKAQPAHVYHDVHGQLRRQHPNVDAGKKVREQNRKEKNRKDMTGLCFPSSNFMP